MSIQKIPDVVKNPPRDARDFNGVWIEVQIPSKGKSFVDYKSSGTQLAIRVHRGDEVVDSYLQYVYDDGAGRYMNEFIDITLSKCGITDRNERKKVWEYRVTYQDDIPTYKAYGGKMQRNRRQQLEKTRQELMDEFSLLSTKKDDVLRQIHEVEDKLDNLQ